MQRLLSIDRLTQVLDAVANGITVQEPSGKLVFVNQAAARMMRCSGPEEAIRKGGAAIMSEFEFVNEFGRPIKLSDLPGRQALRGVPEPSMVVGYAWHGQKDDMRWTAIKALPVTGDDGKVVLSVNVLEDITDQRRAELRLKEANARVTKLLEQTLEA